MTELRKTGKVKKLNFCLLDQTPKYKQQHNTKFIYYYSICLRNQNFGTAQFPNPTALILLVYQLKEVFCLFPYIVNISSRLAIYFLFIFLLLCEYFQKTCYLFPVYFSLTLWIFPEPVPHSVFSAPEWAIQASPVWWMPWNMFQMPC